MGSPDNCNHPNLKQIVNEENGGVKSKIYQCSRCLELLVVEAKPQVISASTGAPEVAPSSVALEQKAADAEPENPPTPTEPE